jgi:CheY-like chemotaxis protein
MTATQRKPSEQVILANEEFIAMLAHEFRNPLAPIMNALHVIDRNANGNQLVRNSANILNRQVNHIVTTINNLLDIAKIAKKEMVLNRQDVELCTLVQNAIESCNSTFDSRKHQISVTLPTKGVWVYGDKDRLHQILMHLLHNAVKFTETGGKISITMSYSEKNAVINIKDTGVGIPANALNEIFNLFSQPDHTRNMAQGGGLGIGLTLIRELAFLHEGSIEAHSAGIGTGSEFSLVLPVCRISEDIPHTNKTPTQENPSRCFEILVVDDHIDTAESLAVLLKMWGHITYIAHNGTTALEVARLRNPDVVLLDIGLPGIDGYEVASKLNKDFPDMLLIAISGYGQKVDKRRSDAAGFKEHLVKPVTADKLKEALASKG